MRTIKLLVEIKLDPVPGFGHQPEDFVEYFRSTNTGIQHYIESTSLVEFTPSASKQLFVITFTVVGEAASYDRTVIVSATGSKEAEDAVAEHFKTVRDVRIAEVLAKFNDKIFGIPVLQH